MTTGRLKGTRPMGCAPWRGPEPRRAAPGGHRYSSMPPAAPPHVCPCPGTIERDGDRLGHELLEIQSKVIRLIQLSLAPLLDPQPGESGHGHHNDNHQINHVVELP